MVASLVEKDTSGIYIPQAGETELPDERTRCFKKFSLPDASGGRKRFRVSGQVGPIHYRLDPFGGVESYKEIDLDVQLTPGESWDAACEANGYQVRFWQSRVVQGKTVRYVAQFRRAGKWLAMAPLVLLWKNDAGERQVISKALAVGAPTIDNDAYRVTWDNVFGSGLHYRYNLQPDEFFKTLIISDKSDLPTPTIGLAGLKLTLVMAFAWDGSTKAGNGFAAANTVEELAGDEELGIADEELQDPGMFPYLNEQLRDVWFLRPPEAWDSATVENRGSVEWKIRRHSNRIFGVFSVPATWLNRPEVVYPVYVDAVMAEEQTAATDDDARNNSLVYPGDGSYSHAYTVQTLGGIALGPTNYYDINGVRFTPPLPQGCTVDNAWVSWCADASPGTSTVHTKIACEDVDAAGAFASGSHEPYDSQQAATTEVVHWDILTTWSAGTWYGGSGETDEIDIAAPVHEVVNRGSWSSGNGLVVVDWWDNGDGEPLVADLTRRYIRTYDYAGNIFGPKLNAVYTSPPGPCAQVMTTFLT